MSHAPHRIEKQKDGRHAVMRGDTILGLHKSIWSAARQFNDLGGQVVEADPGRRSEPAGQTPDVTPEVPLPKHSELKKVMPNVPNPLVPRP